MPLDVWIARVREFLEHVSMLFAPNLVIFGGGISKRFADFGDAFDIGVDIVPAEMRNNAGIVGAAVAAHQSWAPAR